MSVLKRRYWGGVFAVRSRNAPVYVCKTGDAFYDPESEAEMLTRLAASGLPVARPVYVESGLLVLEGFPAVPADCHCITRAGSAVAAMHEDDTSGLYGYPNSTFFGALKLDNDWSQRWSSFFIERRLRRFAAHARDSAWLADDLDDGVQAAAQRLADIMPEPDRPALLHGDLWANNIQSVEGFPLFLDPAAFYGDPDYDVAFMATYLDMRQAAIKAYRRARSLGPEFWRIKLPAYRLAFHLAHLALFGERFAPAVRAQISHVLAI
ncbi:fructosamine kinase family protein [Bradyrhizobium sp. HKCCYLS3013]|uniref:fructosamine kinase family protein n=1 Tax=Bradyrhizobium sp. HKCCYLS3013 TaxID=3420735 RepID=UPI003EBC0E2E